MFFLFGGEAVQSGGMDWYAAVPLLCVAPALVFMLWINEQAFARWLYILAGIKALTVPALGLYIVRNAEMALRSGYMDDFTLLGSIMTALLVIILDSLTGILFYKRGRTACK